MNLGRTIDGPNDKDYFHYYYFYVVNVGSWQLALDESRGSPLKEGCSSPHDSLLGASFSALFASPALYLQYVSQSHCTTSPCRSTTQSTRARSSYISPCSYYIDSCPPCTALARIFHRTEERFEAPAPDLLLLHGSLFSFSVGCHMIGHHYKRRVAR